ncbi:MAG: tripartite tricarboxylate transporter substrate binding protein, partial [Deltaproteobacteria bacterium]|nr:tripartite tricarboxylate transporter substrate binding protein [Deltaproteobacteria bacterium]
MAIVAGLPDDETGWPGLLKAMPSLLRSRERAQVDVIFNPSAGGVLAANLLSLGDLEGYAVGAFPMSTMVTRVVEDRTPYVLDDFAPLVLARAAPYALLANKKAPFADLAQLAKAAKTREVELLHDGLAPINPGPLLALAALGSLGFKPSLTQVKSPSPAALFGEADRLLAWPLDRLPPEIPADAPYKIVAIL